MKKKISRGTVIYIIFSIILLFSIWKANNGDDDVILKGSSFRGSGGQITEDEAVYMDEQVDLQRQDRKTASLILNKGTYFVTVHYKSESDENTMVIENQGIPLETVVLSKDAESITTEVTLDSASQQFWCLFQYSGKGTLTLYDVTVSCKGLFYTDIYFEMVVVAFLLLLGYILYQREWTKEEQKKKLIIGMSLVAIAIYATYPYLNDTLWSADDLYYHLLRIEGIKDGLLDGQFPVIIFPNALEGNGYLNCMYPSLFLYIPAMLRLLNVSLMTSYKFLVVMMNMATVGIMYYSVKEFGGSRKIAILAAFLYTLFPYRFTNIYGRGAIGEAIAMTFFPLLFVGLYHVLCNDRKKWYLLVIAMIALLQSHILSVLLAAGICIVFGIIYIGKVWHEKRYIEIFYSVFWFGILNVWYLIPFLMFYLRGSLWMSSLDWSTFEEYAVNIYTLMKTASFDTYRCYSLGLALLCCAGIGLLYFFLNKISSEKDKWLFSMLILGAVCAYITTNHFSGWEFMKWGFFDFLFTKIQFPWRLLTISGCIFAMVGAICLEKIDVTTHVKQGVIIFLIGLTLLSTMKTENIPVYETITSTITEGHVKKAMGIPVWKGSSLSYPYDWRLGGSNDSSIEAHPVLSDDTLVEIDNFQKKGTSASYLYRTEAEGQYIEAPLLAYKGYKAYDEDGNKLKIHKEADSCNRIRIYLEPDGKWHSVSISYEGYWFMTLANIVSLVAILYLVVWYFRKRYMVVKGKIYEGQNIKNS